MRNSKALLPSEPQQGPQDTLSKDGGAPKNSQAGKSVLEQSRQASERHRRHSFGFRIDGPDPLVAERREEGGARGLVEAVGAASEQKPAALMLSSLGNGGRVAVESFLVIHQANVNSYELDITPRAAWSCLLVGCT